VGGTTATYALPYPAETDTPDGPSQIAALAVAVDSTLNAEMAAVQAEIAAGQPVYASAQIISTTGPTPITGLTIPLTAGTYRLRLHLWGTCSIVAGVTYTVTFAYTGGVTSTALNGWNYMAGAGGAINQTAISMTALGIGTPSLAAAGTGFAYQVETIIEGIITLGSAGTLQAQAQSSVSGDAVHIAGSTWMDAIVA
jgi:hypothetical protein